MTENNKTVIVTSFWNRPILIRSLYKSTSMSASLPWRMLVVDNGSIGETKEWLRQWGSARSNVEIIEREPFSPNGENRRGSAEHGSALDFAMGHLRMEKSMVVIMDTDIIWLKPKWDKLFFEKLNNHDHVTTHRKDCTECPAPYISAFYMDFIHKNKIAFTPRLDEKMIVKKPTSMNDVGWMMNDYNGSGWCRLEHKTPGIGYARALAIRHESDPIAEHLYAGRKRSAGRIIKWVDGCFNELRKNIKKDLKNKKV